MSPKCQKETLGYIVTDRPRAFLPPQASSAPTTEHYCVVVSDKILPGAVAKCLRSPFQPSMTTIA
jgi:hypothetical protein